MLAVIAESTRMHSSPSRKTSTAISRTATVLLVCGWVGSGAPFAVTACQINTPSTTAAAIKRTSRNSILKGLMGAEPVLRSGSLKRDEAELSVLHFNENESQ